MSNELITQQNLTKELLSGLFEAAFVQPQFDDDGDLQGRDGELCWVMVNERRSRMRLYSQWRFKPDAEGNERLACGNRINFEYLLPRAYFYGDGLCFDYIMPVDGGLTRHHVVLTTKAFIRQVVAALTEYPALIQ